MNLPFSHRLPYQRDSALLFSKLHHLPWSAFLESGQPYGRYDILTALPYLTLTTREAGTFIQGGGKESLCNTDPLHLIKQLLMLHPTTASHLPFSGGALGYFSYDFGKKLANISAEAHKMPLTPLIEVGFYDWAIVVDHQDQETFLVSHLHQQETRGVIERILDKLTVPSVLPIDNFH